MSAQLASAHVTRLLAELRGRGADSDAVRRLMQAELKRAQRTAAGHRELLRFLGDQDPTISVTLRLVLVEDDERAEDLSELLRGFEPRALAAA